MDASTVEHTHDHDAPSAPAVPVDLNAVPTQPGCYLMLGEHGKVLYVGKAKNLRSRLRAYLNATDSRYSVTFLMRRVKDIQWLTTENEKEALLLENNLIKQHKPRYNVRLRDDKTYVSLRIRTDHPFPRLEVVRQYKQDGAKYFGPYQSAHEVRDIVRQLQRFFPLRTCSDYVLKTRTRPCVYYQMKRCAAPCVGYVNPEAYAEWIKDIVLILQGRCEELERRILDQIRAHSDKLEFEQAAALRDRLFAFRRMLDVQRATHADSAIDRDVFGIFTAGRHVEICILFYRGGRMVGSRKIALERADLPLEEWLASFLLQYYAQSPTVPDEVLVPIELEETEALAEILRDRKGSRVALIAPKRGERNAVLALAEKNAEENYRARLTQEQARADVLQHVQAILHLPSIPRRIECFDISTLQGHRTVGAMVVFENGMPAKQRYRRYEIRGQEGQDDFAALREVLLRRYRRAREENDLPDLVLIDGGKGQLHVAQTALKDLGLETLPCAAIAKSRSEGGKRSPERFFIPNRSNPIVPPADHPAVLFLSRIRDETHRYVITFHRRQRNKATLKSTLTIIPGVGAKRANLLLTRFGSVPKIAAASPEELMKVPGISATLAQTIHSFLKDWEQPRRSIEA
jgi:excinuclease ABC subunit C